MVKEYLEECIGTKRVKTEGDAIKMLIGSHKRQRRLIANHNELLHFLNSNLVGKLLLKRFMKKK